MQYMAALWFRSEFTERFYGHRPVHSDAGQVSLIFKLWDEYIDGECSTRLPVSLTATA